MTARTDTQVYFDNFFSEKEIPYKMWEIEGTHDMHMIDSEFVIELIKGTSGPEANSIMNMLTMIDFKNGDVLNYLEHLARGYIAQQDTATK